MHSIVTVLITTIFKFLYLHILIISSHSNVCVSVRIAAVLSARTSRVTTKANNSFISVG